MKNTYYLYAFLISVLFSCNRISNENQIQSFIDEGIKEGKREIVIPPGEYRVKPINKSHLTLNGLKDVIIDATGVKMICLETTRAITIMECENVTIKGLTIDYDPLCYTQGRIINLSEDKKTIDFLIDEGYPENLEERIEIFDSETKTLKRSTYYGWTDFQKIAEHTYRVTKGDNYTFNPSVDMEEVGDILVTNNVYVTEGSIPHAIYSDACKNMLFEDITLYSGNCFAFFETNGTKNTYLRCKVERCPIENDYEKRAMRIRSNNADAFHSKHAYVGPQLIQCEASFQGDDGVNICGKYYFSLGASDGNIRIVPLDDCNLSVGDSIEVLTFDGERLPLFCVKAIEEGGNIDADELEQIKDLPSNDRMKARLLKKETYLNIKVDRDVDLKLGAVVGNRNRMGNGFLIKDCNFSHNRSRGVLIKGSNGKVINNTFVGNWMYSILVTPETWWLESGSSDNVLIDGNKFIENKKQYAINVSGCGFSRVPSPIGLHNNIIVKNNTFDGCPLPVIRFQSVNNGLVSENSIVGDNIENSDLVEYINCNH